VDLRNAGWAGIAIGTTSAIIAIGSSIVMLQNEATRREDCNVQKVCTPAGTGANASIANNAVPNAVMWAGAIVGLGVGTFLVLTNPPDHSLSVGVAPRGSGADLALEGTF
jgi:hypothetical protein